MPGPSAPKEEAGLIRAIGVPGLAANIVNSTIGAGIFAMPAAVALQLGAASPLAYVICAFAMCLFVTSFAMAGSRVPLTGGLYAYVEVAFGRYVGFLAGVLYFLTAILAISGIVGLIAVSVGGLIPPLATPIGRFAVILFVFLFLASINVRGVRIGARAVETVTLIKLAPLIIFVVAGIFFIRPEALVWPGWPQSDALGRSILLLLFAFVGVEVALVPSGEIKQPARTVPRAIFTALGVTTLLLLSILCCLAAIVLNRRDIRSDPAIAGFKFPGASIIPILAIIVIIWILAHATWKELTVTAACLIFASLLYLIRQFFGSELKNSN